MAVLAYGAVLAPELSRLAAERLDPLVTVVQSRLGLVPIPGGPAAPCALAGRGSLTGPAADAARRAPVEARMVDRRADRRRWFTLVDAAGRAWRRCLPASAYPVRARPCWLARHGGRAASCCGRPRCRARTPSGWATRSPRSVARKPKLGMGSAASVRPGHGSIELPERAQVLDCQRPADALVLRGRARAAQSWLSTRALR